MRTDTDRIDWLDEHREKLEQIVGDIDDGMGIRDAFDRAIDGWEWDDDEEDGDDDAT